MTETTLFSINEYLALEKKAEEKHEYQNGTIVKRKSSSLAHAIICTNALAKFSNQEKEYLTLDSQIKIFIEKANSFVYPDGVVIWEKPKFPPQTNHAITNPNLIIEVTSDTTESYDRGRKLHFYSTLSSLKEYILIDQNKAVVDSFHRDENNLWKIRIIEGLDKSFPIHTLGFDINMADLYKKVPNLKNPQFNLDL